MTASILRPELILVHVWSLAKSNVRANRADEWGEDAMVCSSGQAVCLTVVVESPVGTRRHAPPNRLSQNVLTSAYGSPNSLLCRPSVSPASIVSFTHLLALLACRGVHTRRRHACATPCWRHAEQAGRVSLALVDWAVLLVLGAHVPEKAWAGRRDRLEKKGCPGNTKFDF